MGQQNYRNEMIAKIQIEFPKLRRDLDAGELRAARLEFYRETLGLSYTPSSTTKLSNEQLGKVLDRMKLQMTGGSEPGRPSLTSCTVRPLKPKTREAIEKMGLAAIEASDGSVSCGQRSEAGEVIHLAGNAQAWACARVMEHLEWPDQKRREYITKRFRRTSEKLLKPEQARSLLVQLLTIAAHAELKRRLGSDVKISRDQTDAEIPKLKQRLGIDRSA